MQANALNLLRQESRQMGVELSEQQAKSLMAYLNLLEKWNKAYNLTAVRQREAMRIQHILDSLAIAPWIKADGCVLDMGTGAGLPGVPLAIALPQSRWRLVDSVGKKVRFLNQVRRELGLENIEPVHARLEHWQPETKPDQITARALADLDQLTRLAAPLLDEGGELLAMKARAEVERKDISCASHGFSFVDRQALNIPGLEASRYLLRLRRCPQAEEHLQ